MEHRGTVIRFLSRQMGHLGALNAHKRHPQAEMAEFRFKNFWSRNEVLPWKRDLGHGAEGRPNRLNPQPGTRCEPCLGVIIPGPLLR
ncbi:hypothetical protein E2C01_016217 [Portunus trituberculatus]|uniref:Uncharacterized protein n=1 Tax=Portunus trituberculatus TaxID=210409 RepID=A0A5B7DNZ1_PORTR|nr:hypothetical protein [Portunus trituberculatus]